MRFHCHANWCYLITNMLIFWLLSRYFVSSFQKFHYYESRYRFLLVYLLWDLFSFLNQSLRCTILVCLVHLRPLGLLLIPVGVAVDAESASLGCGVRVLPYHPLVVGQSLLPVSGLPVPLDSRRESLTYRTQRVLLWQLVAGCPLLVPCWCL